MRPSNILTSLALLTAVSSAFEWPSLSDGLALAKHEVAPLFRRQNNNNNNNNNDNNNNNQDQQSSSAAAASSSQGNDNNNNNNNNKPTATASSSSAANNDGKKTTATGKNGDDNKKTTTQQETTKTFDPRLPAGGVSMVTPNIMSGAQYYKIADYVTFAWNFTSLSVTPTALDIMATCTTNSALYTIAVNQTVAGKTQAVTWDTGEYQSTATIPLLVATYTLLIYDADSSISATPQAGYLGVYDQFTFGMYTPQPYTPMADFVCATCNSANSMMDRHTWKFLLGMAAMTVLSFGWFAGVAGLW